MSGEYLTGIIHFHSCYSFDSITSIRSIISAAKREHLDFAILADHDTIDGSIALREQVARNGLSLEVPIAAEYLTDKGDVIAAFIKHNIAHRDFAGLVKEVHDQDGLVLLPHPYVGHSDVDTLTKEVDMIEIFNGRASSKDNDRACLLAQQWNKPFYFGSDAHLAANVTKVIISVANRGNLLTSLLNGKIEPVKCLTVSDRDMTISRLIKIAKTRDFKPLASAIRKRVRRLIRREE